MDKKEDVVAEAEVKVEKKEKVLVLRAAREGAVAAEAEVADQKAGQRRHMVELEKERKVEGGEVEKMEENLEIEEEEVEEGRERSDQRAKEKSKKEKDEEGEEDEEAEVEREEEKRAEQKSRQTVDRGRRNEVKEKEKGGAEEQEEKRGEAEAQREKRGEEAERTEEEEEDEEEVERQVNQKLERGKPRRQETNSPEVRNKI